VISFFKATANSPQWTGTTSNVIGALGVRDVKRDELSPIWKDIIGSDRLLTWISDQR